MLLGPDEFPGAVFAGVFTKDLVGVIVAVNACCQVVCVANVEAARGIV